MLKKTDKLFNKLYDKRLSSGKTLLVMMAAAVILLITLVTLTAFITFLVSKIPYFSTFSKDELSSSISSILFMLFFMYMLAFTFHIFIEERKERKRLANRTLSDYATKHKIYVELVERMLKKEEYKNLTLYEEWVKRFDLYITKAPHLCKESFYSDFEIAASLMYALTFYDQSTPYVSFAFECAKELITKPKTYNFMYSEGGELTLELKAYLDSIAGFIPDSELPEQALLVIISTYLSQRDSYYDIIYLANFLHILTIRQYTIR